VAENEKNAETPKPSMDEIIEVGKLIRKIADRHARGEISKADIEELANQPFPVPFVD
jgi:hypothetical protein